MVGCHGERLCTPGIRDSAPARLGWVRDPDAPSGIGWSELPLGRTADEGVVVLLPGGVGRQGAPRLLAPGGRPAGVRGSRRSGVRGEIADEPAAAGLFALSRDHGGRLVAELRGALPSSPGAAGDRLGLGSRRAPRDPGASRRRGRPRGLRGRGCRNPSTRADVFQRPRGRAAWGGGTSCRTPISTGVRA